MAISLFAHGMTWHKRRALGLFFCMQHKVEMPKKKRPNRTEGPSGKPKSLGGVSFVRQKVVAPQDIDNAGNEPGHRNLSWGPGYRVDASFATRKLQLVQCI